MSSKIVRWIVPAVLVVASLAGGGFFAVRLFGTQEKAAAREGRDVSPSLGVVRPTRQDVVQAVEQPARIEAFEQTPIHARITGYVAKVHVEIGTEVKKGDVLAELSVPEMREELAQKKAQVAQARSHVTQAEKALRMAQANARSVGAAVALAKAGRKRATASLARWKSESERMEKLASERVIDLQSRDETRSQYRSSEAELEEATARVTAAGAALEESEAKIEKAQADLESARSSLVLVQADERRVTAMVGYAQLVAPYDGVVAQRNVHTGHLLMPPSDASKAAPLFVVVRTDKVRLYIDVPEGQAVNVSAGDSGSPATIRVPALNDRKFTGRVAMSSWSLDPQQRTMRTEIDFDNPQRLLRPGMYAHAILDATHSRAWTLPAAAVQTQDNVTFCWLVREGKAKKTALRVGKRHEGVVEVLKKQMPAPRAGDPPTWEELDGSESVLTGDVGGLADGQSIDVPSARQTASR